MRIINNFFLFVLIVCIPFISLFAALNIVLRMPDLYAFEFNSAEITKEIELGMKDDELGAFFSDYMLHKNEKFDLIEEYQEREKAVFKNNEQINMEYIRNLLDKTLICMGSLFAIMLIIYWNLLIRKNKLALRNAFKNSVFLYLFIIVVSAIAYNIQYVQDMIYQFIFVAPFEKDNVLPLLLTEQFARDCILAIAVLAAIIIAIFASITWRLTKPRRMFGKL